MGTDGADDLRALIASARAGRILRPPVPGREVAVFVAGLLLSRPEATEGELANLLVDAGLGPLAWANARAAVAALKHRIRRPIRSSAFGPATT